MMHKTLPIAIHSHDFILNDCAEKNSVYGIL